VVGLFCLYGDGMIRASEDLKESGLWRKHGRVSFAGHDLYNYVKLPGKFYRNHMWFTSGL
jgi:hypothetical protein